MRSGPLSVFFVLVLLLLFTSCAKDKEILVPDNQAPPDPTIENIIKENYVNRSYIALLGRKPSSTEYTNAYNLIDQANLSQGSREQMLSQVMSNPEYSYNLYIQANNLLLNGTDTTEIQEKIYIYNFLLQDSNYIQFWPEIQQFIDEMQIILDVPKDLRNGDITVAQMHRRLVDNYIYDEINMGSLNFVISIFQNLLQRFPTSDELAEGVKMVDGLSANVFLQNGNSKEEFLEIFFGSKDYYEGQVRELFSRFLFRNPSSTEMAEHAITFYNSKDYDQLMVTILSSDEYVGIE